MEVRLSIGTMLMGILQGEPLPAILHPILHGSLNFWKIGVFVGLPFDAPQVDGFNMFMYS